MATSKKSLKELRKMKARLKKKLNGVRTIRTDYYCGSQLVKSTSSVWANNASVNAVNHLQKNDYGATSVEVFDEVDGTLHAVLTRTVNKATGLVTIITAYKREILEKM